MFLPVNASLCQKIILKKHIGPTRMRMYFDSG